MVKQNIKEKRATAIQKADEKIAVATQTFDMVDGYIRQLGRLMCALAVECVLTSLAVVIWCTNTHSAHIQTMSLFSSSVRCESKVHTKKRWKK
jgi:hypothetical protein